MSNEHYPAALEAGRLYSVVPDGDAEREGMIRVIDESGEDYLYPADRFAAPGPGAVPAGSRPRLPGEDLDHEAGEGEVEPEGGDAAPEE